MSLPSRDMAVGCMGMVKGEVGMAGPEEDERVSVCDRKDGMVRQPLANPTSCAPPTVISARQINRGPNFS
jgi:hypothetical protein